MSSGILVTKCGSPALEQRVIQRAIHRMFRLHRTHLGCFTPTSHRNYPRKLARADFLWAVTVVFSQSPSRNLRVFCEAVVGGIGNVIYGNRILCFAQPNTDFPLGMWLFLPRIICFLGLPPSTPTILRDWLPPHTWTQLPNYRLDDDLHSGKALFFMHNKVGRKPRRGDDI